MVWDAPAIVDEATAFTFSFRLFNVHFELGPNPFVDMGIAAYHHVLFLNNRSVNGLD